MLADSADGYPAVSTYVHVYVPDVDAAYERALAAGATSVQMPVKKEDLINAAVSAMPVVQSGGFPRRLNEIIRLFPIG
ncbi:MAG: hypothetical protein R3C44_15695 [Chloroflexota bacterium]